MKIKLNITILFVLLTAGAAFGQQNINGSWKINLSKSDFGGAPSSIMPSQIDLRQKADSLWVIFHGTQTASSSYLLDGKAVEKSAEGATLKTTMGWSADRHGFQKEQSMISTQGTIIRTIKETWVISLDGKTLNIQQAVSLPSAPAENYETNLIYEKQ